MAELVYKKGANVQGEATKIDLVMLQCGIRLCQPMSTVCKNGMNSLPHRCYRQHLKIIKNNRRIATYARINKNTVSARFNCIGHPTAAAELYCQGKSSCFN